MENALAIVVKAAENLPALQTMLAKVTAFQELVRSQLTEGADYGRIPGCGDRAVLLKPGAEKITVLLGLRSRFEVVQQIEDWEKGFFAYTVRCSLVTASGEVVTEGFGACNTRERRFVRGDPFAGANVALKMARKRALVDAALTVGSLSNLFTQDLEDTTESAPAGDVVDESLASATEAQIRKIRAMATEAGMNDAQLHTGVAHYYDVAHLHQLTRRQASDLIDRLASRSRGAA